MSTTTAVARKIHLSAQKGRLVADQIRGLPVEQALNILNFSPKKAAVIIKKALESAIANAEHNDGADIDELKVKIIYVDKAASGRAFYRQSQRVRAIVSRSRPATSQSPSGTKGRSWDRKFIQSVSGCAFVRTGLPSGTPTARILPALLLKDIKVRDFLKKKLASAGVSKVDHRASGQECQNYDLYRASWRGDRQEGRGYRSRCAPNCASAWGCQSVDVAIEEVRKPEIDAQLIAESITAQLEKRIMFRRAMKRAMQNAMRLGAQGIKIMSAGRLNGIEIARTEWYREGRVPLHTLRADIDYGTAEAKTTYGVIGVKVWVFKGEVYRTRKLLRRSPLNRKRK